MMEYETELELVEAMAASADVEGKDRCRVVLNCTAEHQEIVTNVAQEFAELYDDAFVLVFGSFAELQRFFEPLKSLDWPPETKIWEKAPRIDLRNESCVVGVTLNDATSFAGRKNASVLIIYLDKDELTPEYDCVIRGLMSGQNHYVILFNHQ